MLLVSKWALEVGGWVAPPKSEKKEIKETYEQKKIFIVAKWP